MLKSLQTNAKILSEHGVSLLGPRRFRQVFKSPLNALSKGPVPASSIDNMRSLVPAESPNGRVVMTCADFVGERQSAIQDGQFYPEAGHRLAFLDEVYDANTVELYIGIRNPGSFIPKVLMSLPEPHRQDIIRTTDLSCLSWVTLVEDIRDLAPDVSVTLWANEDTPLIWGDVVRSLCAFEPDVPLVDEFSLLSSLVSDDGKQEISALTGQASSMDRPTLQDRLSEIFEEFALPEEIEEEMELPGWSLDIFDAFSELYAQDLARLKTMPGVRFLGR
ncbi:MAG: hypothetical protein ACWA49_00820 [Ruegeria sp.]